MKIADLTHGLIHMIVRNCTLIELEELSGKFNVLFRDAFFRLWNTLNEGVFLTIACRRFLRRTVYCSQPKCCPA